MLMDGPWTRRQSCLIVYNGQHSQEEDGSNSSSEKRWLKYPITHGKKPAQNSTTHVERRRERKQDKREEMLDFPLSFEISTLYRDRASDQGAQEHGVFVFPVF